MTAQALPRISSGIPGLDTILRGGIVEGRMYLISGEPGTGKTLLGMSFLEAGLEEGETALFIHGEESRQDILDNGRQVGIDLSDAAYLDLGPDSEFFRGEQSYELVDPRDIESERTIERIRTAIEERDPDRILFDPITQLQAIEPDEYQYRKRLVSFMRFLQGQGVTVLSTQTPGTSTDATVRSLSDGVIRLEREATGRRIAVEKHRGVGQRDGTHGLEIREAGLEVYPALDPAGTQSVDPEQLSTGLEEFDALLGGGIERGTVTVLAGPTGVGKTTLATKLLEAAAADGRPASMYQFEEAVETLRHRSAALGIDLPTDDELRLAEIEPLALSPEEFARRVKQDVDDRGTELIVIDGTEGYQLSLHGEGRDVVRSLHSLCRYLTGRTVSVVLIDQSAHSSAATGPTSENFSYLADNLVVLNYIEREGRKERVAGVMKKRLGDHEETVRPYTLDSDGIVMRGPETDVEGFLTGTPTYRRSGEE
ncbi:AAA family ATPase [Halovenus sp. WSH3]|uniref:non-specific serine/threonine protein kinase n=1 Tax=Halovenus carboxidivorans TaxID=2692199 RepID=A0A6B0T9W4_9EURY|nr:ATPase domain-containing protein [Halovenus carboxidivorans]MXR52152.1 AAA family ATPase [Halovenus carboxidivorans]